METYTIELIRHGMTLGNTQHRYIGGKTDEDLCPEGIEQGEVLYHQLGTADVWLLSPMRRCLETACLAAGLSRSDLKHMIEVQASGTEFVTLLRELCPDSSVIVEPDLRECCFGKFEGHNWEELSEDPAYQTWIDSNGMGAFPGGEDQESFTNRTALCFKKQLKHLLSNPANEEAKISLLKKWRALRSVDATQTKKQNFTLRIVAHGGTIMSLMDRYGLPDQSGERKSYYEWNLPNAGVLRAHLVLTEGKVGMIPEEIKT